MPKAVVAVMLAAALLASAAVAVAVPGSQTQSYRQSFKAKTSNTSTASTFSESSTDPGNTGGNGQPVPASEIDLAFPAGSVVDYTAMPVCKARDDRITQSGGTACPKKTQVGSGSATASVPFPGYAPIDVQLTAWNGRRQIIVYGKPAVGQPFVLRAKVTGNPKNRPTLVTEVPPNCVAPSVRSGNTCSNPNGGPAQQAVLTSFTLKTSKSGTSKKPYVRTPKKCVRSKGWVFTATFKYQDGTSRSMTSRSPCRK